MRALEARLGVRLLTRTTRSVSPTEAGERLLRRVGPRIDDIQSELAAALERKDSRAGTIRISAGDHAVSTVLWPKLPAFLRRYPDIKVEIAIDYGLTDIVAERYDAGVRWGEQIAGDMIAARIGPDLRFTVVGSKSYLAANPPPRTPRDLVHHRCVNLRFPTHGGLYAWEFEKNGRDLKVRVDGQFTVNGIFQVLDAALAGLGLAMCLKTSRARIWPRGASCRCWKSGARPGPAITSTIPIAAEPRPPSPCWSKPCAITAKPPSAHGVSNPMN